MIKFIQKRDGRVVPFDQSKITNAVLRAAKSVGGDDQELAEKISNQVAAVLEVFFKDEKITPTVEQIQDLVEKILIEGGHAKTAKAYILYRQKRAIEREQRELILGKDKAYDNLNFSNNALEVLKRRYLLKDVNGNIIESPKEMVERIANNIALADKRYGTTEDEYQETARVFFGRIADLEFMPNSPTIMNAGTDIQQLSACFVLPVPDSIEGIFDALKYQAIIHKTGGGTGFSFSRLRPANDLVKSTHGVSSGPVSFMKIFDAATQQIKQGGKRRGANMGVLRVDHPDIFEFIICKSDMHSLTNFNISVAATDKFMDALLADSTYELINPRNGEAVRTVKAREVFNLIVQNAWLNGDPGLFFIDRANETNPCPHLGEIEATNPCGEQDLLPYDSCNLGSIAVNKFVKADGSDFNWKRLKECVYDAVHFLDNVIDMNRYPISQIKETSEMTRRIGLGIMGFADALYRLGIPYNSEDGFKTGEKLMKFIHDSAVEKSIELVKKRGCFKAYKGSLWEKKGVKIRNSYLTTIAPTGTIGMIAEASSGLEPNYAICYIKNVMDGTELLYTNNYFEEAAKKEGFYSKELMAQIAKTGSIQGFTNIPERMRRIFVVAQDISPEDHVKMQTAFQKYCDAAVSKTINFNSSATMGDIEKAYILAYKLKCKGITIYRDGSREAQVLNIGQVNKKRPEMKKSADEKADEKIVKKNNPKIAAGENGGEKPEIEYHPTKRELMKTKICPECKSKIEVGEGCILCMSCGFSACAI